MDHRGALKSQPPGYSFRTDSYDMFQLIFVSSGELLFRGTDAGSADLAHPIQTLVPGDVVVLRYASRFRLSSPDSGYGGVCYLDFEPTEPIQEGDSFALTPSDWLVTIIGQMQFALSYPELCTQETLALLGRTIAWHALHERDGTAPAGGSGGTASMLDRIWGERLRHLVQNTLYADHDEFRESVASLPLSYRQLARHFRADVGMSIKQYQIQERIKEAKRLLRNTGLSVTDVAFELHYASSQKFAAQFKAVTGMTPGEYRGR